MIQHSNTVTKLFEALHEAQGKMRTVPEDSKNPHFGHRYASLEAVVATIKQPLADAGLVYLQAPGEISDGGQLAVETMVAHRSGEWLKATLHVPLIKRDPQALGSAISYGKRYALMALFGLPSGDDDGEAHRQPEAERPSTGPAPAVNVATWLERIGACDAWPELQKLRDSEPFKRAWRGMTAAEKERITKLVNEKWPVGDDEVPF